MIFFCQARTEDGRVVFEKQYRRREYSHSQSLNDDDVEYWSRHRCLREAELLEPFTEVKVDCIRLEDDY